MDSHTQIKKNNFSGTGPYTKQQLMSSVVFSRFLYTLNKYLSSDYVHVSLLVYRVQVKSFYTNSF